MRQYAPAILSLVVSAASAIADQADPARKVAPFLDEETFLAARADVQRVDLDAAWADLDFVWDMLPDEQRAAAETTKEMVLRRWLTAFLGVGGREVYVVASVADFPAADKPRIVVPLEPGADANAIAGLICSGNPEGPTARPDGVAAETIGGAVVLGERRQLERVRTLTPMVRPELAAAFAAVDGAAIQIALIPPDYTRRIVEGFVPTLPAALGGGPSTPLTRGVKWAAIGLNLPPKTSCKIVIQSDDAGAAKALQGLITESVAALAAQPTVQRMCPAAGQIAKLMTPALEGDRLVVALDRQQVYDIARDLLISELFQEARQQTKRNVSLANLRTIAQAVHVYAADHQGRCPESLQAMIRLGVLTDRTLANPLRPEHAVGYVYLSPDAKINDVDPQAIIAHEMYETWPAEGLGVVFADGHAEWLTDEARFKTGLARLRTNGDKR